MHRALGSLTACRAWDKRNPNRWSFYPLGFQLVVLRHWYQEEAWWGELQMSQERKREGKIQRAESGASLRQGAFSKQRTCQKEMQNCVYEECQPERIRWEMLLD